MTSQEILKGSEYSLAHFDKKLIEALESKIVTRTVKDKETPYICDEQHLRYLTEFGNFEK